MTEGATDAEATSITWQAAQSCGITGTDVEAGLVFADVTGTVTAADIEAALLLDHPCARSLGRFGRTVTLRYGALLSELSASPADAHSQIVDAMILRQGRISPAPVKSEMRPDAGSPTGSP